MLQPINTSHQPQILNMQRPEGAGEKENDGDSDDGGMSGATPQVSPNGQFGPGIGAHVNIMA